MISFLIISCFILLGAMNGFQIVLPLRRWKQLSLNIQFPYSSHNLRKNTLLLESRCLSVRRYSSASDIIVPMQNCQFEDNKPKSSRLSSIGGKTTPAQLHNESRKTDKKHETNLLTVGVKPEEGLRESDHPIMKTKQRSGRKKSLTAAAPKKRKGRGQQEYDTADANLFSGITITNSFNKDMDLDEKFNIDSQQNSVREEVPAGNEKIGGLRGLAQLADSSEANLSEEERVWLPNIYKGDGYSDDLKSEKRELVGDISPELLALGEKFVWDDYFDDVSEGEVVKLQKNKRTKTKTNNNKLSMKQKNGSCEGGDGKRGTCDVVAAKVDEETDDDYADIFTEHLDHYLHSDEEPSPIRLRIIAVISVSADGRPNSTVVDCVNAVYDFIQRGTANDSRISYQTLCLAENDLPLEEMDGVLQMWAEGYNTHHLVDGLAMKEAWGAVAPHILLSPRNLQALLDKVLWALEEDSLDGALLSPRMRRIRLRGGVQEMDAGFNTEQLDNEFSVVSVR